MHDKLPQASIIPPLHAMWVPMVVHVLISSSRLQTFLIFYPTLPSHNYQFSKNHGLVSVQLAMPAPVQSRTSLKNVPKLPPLYPPSRDDQLPSCEIGQEFRISLTQGLVDDAFKQLAHELNRLLIDIAKKQGHHIPKAGNRFAEKYSFMRSDDIPQLLDPMPAPFSVGKFIKP